MKRFLTLMLFAMLFGAVAMADGGQPTFLKTLETVDRVHDFGTIYEKDGKVSHTFTLRNNGTSPVAISEVNTWCGCMVANHTKKAIRPGEDGKVTVSFDPDHKKGNFVKQVVVLLNDGKYYVRLWVKANVVGMVHPVQEDHPYYFGHGLYMSQQLLPFPDLIPGQQHSFELKIANDTDKPMNVEFRRQPNNTVLKMPEKLTLKPKERTSIRVSYRYFRKHKATRYIHVTPIVNGKEGKPLTIRWNAANKFHFL